MADCSGGTVAGEAAAPWSWRQLEQFQCDWNLAGLMGFASLNPSYRVAPRLMSRYVGWVERSETHQSRQVSRVSSHTETALMPQRARHGAGACTDRAAGARSGCRGRTLR